VTPSFNQGAYIEETIRSVLLQGYPNLQYLVIDGGSSDQTVGVIRRYEPWIDFWTSEPDRGQSEAINKGLARCDGDWFNWLNSDDTLLPGALFALGRAGLESKAPIVSGLTRNVGSPGAAGAYSARVPASWPGLLFNLGVNQPGSLLRLRDVRAAGGVREDLGLCMDLDLWLRLAAAHGPGPVAQVPDPVATYRYHAASKTCSGADVFALEECRVLAGLAAGLGGLPSGLPEALGDAGAPSFAGPALAARPDPDAVRRAFLERLVVSDSLLYRALALVPGSRDAVGAFLGALEALRPEVARLLPGGGAREVEARALVHALQQLGRPERRMTLRALRLSPGARTLLDVVRLAYHSVSRKP
jgi:hypothetical protein